MSTPALRAHAVSKRYGRVAALRGVDLVVPRGAAFGLIGPNGAGKTTFIKTLLGLVRPDDGEISVLGGQPDDVAVRRRIGYLPENLRIPEVLSARAFLRSVARIKRLHRGPQAAAQPVGQRIDAALRRVGLEPAAWDRRVGGYSKGMRQRTGLAAALLGGPDLLVLDEPTDGIDPLGRAAIRAVIQQETQRGATVFLNSHLLAETERICDEIAIMAAGRVVRAGALAGLRAADRYALTCVDDPAARAALSMRGLGGHVGDGLLRCTLQADGPAALSAALGALLAEGVVVAEVQREVRPLEEVLAEAVRANEVAP